MDEHISETLTNRKVTKGEERNLVFLVVDDREEWLERAKQNVSRYLSTWGNHPFTGYDMYSAKTPERGLELLTEHNPAFVILDINFDPEDWGNQDGLTKFLAPARAQGYKVLIMCWSNDRDQRWMARCAGADDFIEKKRDYDRDTKGALDFLIGAAQAQ